MARRKRKKRERLEEAQQVQQPEKSWEEKQKHREEAIRSVKRSPEYTLLSNLRQRGALPLDGAATPDPTDSSIPKRRWETSIQSWRRDMRDAAEKVMPGLFNIYLRRRAFDDTEIERPIPSSLIVLERSAPASSQGRHGEPTGS